MDPINRLLADLAGAQIGTTFNPYRDTDPLLDTRGAAAMRLENLADHLRARPHPRLLLVGEAAGYAGCRFSGIAFTSERSLPPERRTSRDPRGHVEHSASIVHRLLGELDLEAETVLWNACPTHPAGTTPLSNRTPSKGEFAAGRPFLVRLISILQPAIVVAVGAHAARVLPRLATVRHPANGGASAFRAGLAAVAATPGRSRI
ncbi:MAG TPA: uracil-DNA glycosylase [Candidatus Limnocylindrales bacterium]